VTLLQACVLGILQGGTEFLPVSSSGHLVLVPWLLDWQPPSLVFDAVVHWGTALAVIIYFWRDWVSVIGAALRSLRRGTPAEPRARLAWLILVGTVPAALTGYLLEDFFEGLFARPVPAASFLVVTAALLVAAEQAGERQRDLDGLRWRDAGFVGLAQALAIFPGISRSGATIAAGLVLGLRREQAARFSFLLATPVILGAGLLEVADVAQAGRLSGQMGILIAGFLAAAATGLGCIHLLIRYLRTRRLYPFAAYCAVAGCACLGRALLGGQ
jgi:undecaprenyl-diphosphatase